MLGVDVGARLAHRLRHRRRARRARRRSGRADARRLSRDGHPDPGRSLRRHGGRRHGLAARARSSPASSSASPSASPRSSSRRWRRCRSSCSWRWCCSSGRGASSAAPGRSADEPLATAGRRQPDWRAARRGRLIGLDRAPPRACGDDLPRGLPLARALQGARHQHPHLRAVRAGLQPALRLYRHAVLRACGACSGSAPMAAACRSSKFGVPWFVGLPLGVVIAGLAAAVIGCFATRTRGIYFAMVTLALSQLVYYVVFQCRVADRRRERPARRQRAGRSTSSAAHLNLARPDA